MCMEDTQARLSGMPTTDGLKKRLRPGSSAHFRARAACLWLAFQLVGATLMREKGLQGQEEIQWRVFTSHGVWSLIKTAVCGGLKLVKQGVSVFAHKVEL